MNRLHRQICRASQHEELDVQAFTPPVAGFQLALFRLEADLLTKSKVDLTVPSEELEQVLKHNFTGQMFTVGQLLAIDFKGSLVQFRVVELSHLALGAPTSHLALGALGAPPNPDRRDGGCAHGMLIDATEVHITAAPASGLVVKSKGTQARNIFRPDFNFEQLGIGGLDKEFANIFRRALASHVVPPAMLDKIGIHHVRGLLLYGPPGTGKTLIARQLAKCLHAREPKIVNGPEILSKYVGQSEANIRQLFADAEEEFKARGDDSQLHIIIFDEIDAICKQRGSARDSTGVGDTIVNQLLSKMDGVDSLNNILVIGMTNRKDMIDEALLRPGRLEVHVEISLPDHEGRKHIFLIHTKKARDARLVAPDVDFDELAARTKNYSGAEIEAVVKAAFANVFAAHVNVADLGGGGKAIDTEGLELTMADLLRALDEVRPAFGVDTAPISNCLRNGLVPYGDRFEHLRDTGRALIDQVRSSAATPLLSMLLAGGPGTGKTALAAALASEADFPYVKLVSPDDWIGLSEAAKCARLAKIFDDAYKSPLAIIVLDNLERLIEFVPIGPRFSNAVLQALLVLIKRVPPKAAAGRRLLVIGTTSALAALEDTELPRTFDVTLTVPRLHAPTELQAVLSTYPVDASELQRIITAVTTPLAIKQLLLAAEMTRQHTQREGATFTLERFAESLGHCGLRGAVAVAVEEAGDVCR